MKITMISEEDVKTLKAAKKVLKNLQKKEIKLNNAEEKALVDTRLPYKTAALNHWRFLDELGFLGISVELNDELSLVCPAPSKKGKKK